MSVWSPVVQAMQEAMQSLISTETHYDKVLVLQVQVALVHSE